MSYRYPSELAAASLRAEMARQRKSIRELAGVLHVSRSSAQRRHAGEVALNLDEVALICTWLDIEPGDLLPATA
nr:MAG TPA: SOS-response transcriptional repressor [Caudoviricetes sp.]